MIRMHTQNTVTIRGDVDRIYLYASQVERWPEILPHYRTVSILQAGDRERLVSMACVRSFGALKWPCRWRATQQLRPEENRILFSHVSGPARGMRVEWLLVSKPDGVETTIRHDLDSRTPWGALYSRFIGPVFVHNIAGKTLARIKEIVEGDLK